MQTFSVEVVDHPAVRLVGMKIRSTLPNASIDCPALWQQFLPRDIGELLGGGKNAYGVSIMLNDHEFDYWAAAEIDPKLPVPDDMESVELAHGTYACCSVPGYSALDAAYEYLLHCWLRDQNTSAREHHAHCFELYPSYWHPSIAFRLFVPVKRK